MSEFLKTSIKTLFLFASFLGFVILFFLLVLGWGSVGYAPNYTISLLYLLYGAGAVPLFYAFWLAYSPYASGDWRFGLLAFVLFLFLLYYHYLSMVYALVQIDSLKYLLVVDEFILLYVLMALASALSLALQRDGYIEELNNLEVSTHHFRILLSILLLSLFALYVYEALGEYSHTVIAEAKFGWNTFPYASFIVAILNSGLVPLIFALWIIYSSAVRGDAYYYIVLVFLLVVLYCFQIFFVNTYYRAYPHDSISYWILQAIEIVILYFSITVSVLFAKDKETLPEEEKTCR